jgi:hypothetical protein
MAVSTLHSPAAIQDYITYRAMAHNVSPVLALEIVRAESGFAINAKNASSTASGLGQFINGTFKGFCINEYELTDSMLEKNNPYIQIECLVMMLAAGGDSHWDASRHVWGPRVDKRL